MLAVERQMLHRPLEGSRPLLDRCRASGPDTIELWAAAAMLHAFYNGIENAFKRIAIGFEGAVPHGPDSHRQLLDAMSRPGPGRPAVISEGLRERLDKYLDFRHFFRHAYAIDLRWERMAQEGYRCEDVLRDFEFELDAFLRDLGDKAQEPP